MADTDKPAVEAVSPEVQKDKISFLKWSLVFFLVTGAAVTTWVWSLNSDQKDIYLRYFGFDRTSHQVEMDSTSEYQEKYVSEIMSEQNYMPVVKEKAVVVDDYAASMVRDQKTLAVETVKEAAVSKDNEPHVAEDHSIASEVIIPAGVHSSAVVGQLQKLMLEIHELRQDLRQSQQDQIMLHRANIARQQLDLHTRLRWVLMPNNNWMHLHMYWQDIASLPMLTDSQREQASEQAEKARMHMQRILEWRKQMSLLIHEIQKMRQTAKQSLIPKEGSPWLNWLSGHFSLSHVQADNHEMLDHLELLIQEMLLLGHGQWPSEQRWTDIYQQIILHLPNKVHISVLDFETPAQDRQTMKALAVSWLGQQ